MGAAAVSAVMIAGPTSAQTKTFNVPAQPAATGIAALARQADVQILISARDAQGRSVNAVQGAYDVGDAIRRLLAGTGLVAQSTGPQTWVVVTDEGNDAAAEPAVQLAEVVVTGSLLRGVADGPSPVVVITRDDIDRQGRATVAQALAALPQNFSGTANEGSLNNGGDRSGTNGYYANGVNLRGLGSDATLVLVNGRRVAGTGAKGDFADVSSIPTSVVRRIDVLLDGASALYGADAVGGVVNIILEDAFDGAETRLRYGGATDGATEEVQIAQTVGRTWSTGSLLGSYEFYQRSALAAADRFALAGNADLSAFGGSDFRTYFSNPGNIVVSNGAGGYNPAFAIPRGQDGRNLRPSDFLAGQVNLGNGRQGASVLPRQEREAVYLAGRQAFSSSLVVSGDFRYGLRRYDLVSFPITTVLTVNRSNPYFVSPTGASSHNVAYSFAAEADNPVVNGEVETFAGTLGLDLDLPRGWRLNAYVARGTEEGHSGSEGALQSTNLREALGAVVDSPATPFSAARDGYFNPFGDGEVNPAAVIDFITSGWSRSFSKMTVDSANLMVDGELWNLPGGVVKLAAGLGFRREIFERQVSNFSSGVAPTVGVRGEFERDISAAFAETRIPLLGPDNARPGFQRLELSIAARFEDYGDVGQTTSPKVGLLWEPIDGLIVRSNYGRSFRAPALRELRDVASQSPSILPKGSQQVLSMILYGGNPDLKPEEADTWTIGADYRVSAIPGLRVGVNLFRTDFDNRIGQPALENILTALTDASLSPFVRVLNPANATDRADMQAILDLPTTNLRDLFPATDYGAIVDARYVNTASVEVQGADVNASYAFERGPNAFRMGLNLTYLDRFDSRPTPTAPAVSQLNIPNYPVALRGRLDAGWSRGAWSASSALNIVDSYRDLAGRRIDGWQTLDVQVAWEPSVGVLSGTRLSLSVQNLFDADPPFYNAPQGVAYDGANAGVLGRTASVQLTRAW